MKQYVIDELRTRDEQILKAHLDGRFGPAALAQVYWIPIDPEYYTALQASHENCHPLYFALQLEPGAIVGELLIRTHSRVRCECMGYANDAQRDWFIGLIDNMLEQLEIIT